VHWYEQVVVVLISYFLGCISIGYLLVRKKAGKDIRNEGSGSVGASNVGRILGKTGFIITFAFDCFKGAAAVGMTRFLGFDSFIVTLSMIAVVVGHIFPIQLRFKGGKGISPSLGALLIYDYISLLVLGGVFAITYVIGKNFIISGIISYLLLPIGLIFFKIRYMNIIGIFVLSLIITFAHRENISAELKKVVHKI